VVVMYLGKEVEEADIDSVFYNPLHPYTQALLKSIPKIGMKSRQRLEAIKGMIPDPYNLPKGCPFHPRCPRFMGGKCDRIEPQLIEAREGQWVSCLLYTE